MTEPEFQTLLKTAAGPYQSAYFAGQNARGEFVRLGFNREQVDSAVKAVEKLFEGNLGFFPQPHIVTAAYEDHNRLGLQNSESEQGISLVDAEVSGKI